ncbi:serine threonine- phosphatase 6 regulatory ankyrin repeat subunit B-like [Chlorella sorokiniana]|uniref:Serine threonine-phosphatase 6 regulatory ankyrin repeat subunit B-like n=1 Tax=Chlorella sorokiniana TaxID=3076 RepID=A0A2P6U167_CHLSO|nr:serine threonine- phosphatase 6 regulatory ankyrin repeat subunit B-like [Chlorella sorokiniana]|eukprot:PRW60055.1 serine threonine- phosphatase 6 regulatory ankyrin repeat subunit B-like [Chlorella sorokiniana]
MHARWSPPSRTLSTRQPHQAASQDLTEDLIQAVVDGDTSKLAALLMSKQGRRAGEALTGTEDALLPMAAGLGHVDMIERLMGAGFEVDDCTHYGCTALWMAAFHNPPNALACIDLLLSKGANINATSREKTTPLAMAAMQGHLDIVRRLLAAPGRDVNVRTNLKGSALYLACQQGHPEIVQLLLDAGADVNIVTYDGAKVLSAAATSGNTDAMGRSAYDVARIAASKDRQLQPALQILLEASFSAPSASTSVKCQASQWEASQDLTEDLIQAVVDGDTSKLAALLMSKQGRRAGEALTGTEDALLPMAAGLGHVDMIEHLLGAGFEVDDCTHYGITGLWMAAFYNPPNALACIDLLLSKGANVNATSRERTTPLAMAAMQGHLDIVRRLLAAPGRDVNVRTNLKGSALFLACQRGHPEIVQLLLDAGADVREGG